MFKKILSLIDSRTSITGCKDTWHGKIQSTKAFWALLMVLTTPPEVSWTCSQGSLVITSQGTEMLLLLIPSFHLKSFWKPTDSMRISSTCVSSFDRRLSFVDFDSRKMPDHSCPFEICECCDCCVYTHGGNLLTFPSSLLSPGFSLSLSFPLRVGTQKGTLLQPLYWASFSRRSGPVFYLRNVFLFLNLSSSPAPDINALKPSEDHLLAEWSRSDYGRVMTHTLVVSLCLPWIFYSSWISLSPGNVELSDFSIFLLFPQHASYDPFITNILSKRCICICMGLCAVN